MCQAWRALTKASWTTSSASAKFAGPSRRTSAAKRRADPRRNTSSASAWKASCTSLLFENGANLYGTVFFEDRAASCELDGLFEGRRLDQHVARHHVLRFGKGAVGNDLVFTTKH